MRLFCYVVVLVVVVYVVFVVIVVVVVYVHVVVYPRNIEFMVGGGVKSFSCQTQVFSKVVVEFGL